MKGMNMRSIYTGFFLLVMIGIGCKGKEQAPLFEIADHERTISLIDV